MSPLNEKLYSNDHYRTKKPPSPTAVWIPSWSLKWLNTLTQSTFPDGSHPLLQQQATSQAQISQITQ